MDIIEDLFFLYERGLQSGILGMAFILCSTLPPLICGFIIEARGWPWYHWLVSIIAVRQDLQHIPLNQLYPINETETWPLGPH